MEAILGFAVVALLVLAFWLFQGRSKAERELAVARVLLAQADRRATDYERLKQELMQSAQAAVLKPAQDLSSKLLEDHKRENEAAKKAAEARLKELTDPLVAHAHRLTEAVAALNNQIQDKGKTLDTVMRALSSPGGAGQVAEVGLANTLKSLGLELDRDYVLQFNAPGEAAGQRLRPDAVVFLPGDTVLVIDCKASKAILDIAEAEGPEQEAAAYRGLAATMNQHLKALASKDYQGAVATAFRQSGRGGEIARMLSIMYLPSETVIEKLIRADTEFRRKSQDLGIIPAGPGTLYAVISLAASDIRRQRQAENQARIVESASALVDSLRVVLEAALKVGKGIEMAASAFADFACSVNKRLLPRAGRLTKLGVPTPKALPRQLPSYEVRRVEETIEGEVEEIEPLAPQRPRLISE
jgi:DNA recombination protein RmuC